MAGGIRAMAVVLAAALAVAVGCDRPGVQRDGPAPPGLVEDDTCSTNRTATAYPSPVLIDIADAVGAEPLGVAAYRTTWGEACQPIDAAALRLDCQDGFPWLGATVPPRGSLRLDLNADLATGTVSETVMFFGDRTGTEAAVRLGATDCGGTPLGQQREFTVYRMPDAPEAMVWVAASLGITLWLSMPQGANAAERDALIAGALLRADQLKDANIRADLLR